MLTSLYIFISKIDCFLVYVTSAVQNNVFKFIHIFYELYFLISIVPKSFIVSHVLDGCIYTKKSDESSYLLT